MPGGVSLPGMVHEQVAHHQSRRPEEVAVVVPQWTPRRHPKVGLMNDGGRAQRVARPLPGQMEAGHPLEVRIHQLDQSRQRTAVGLPDRLEQRIDVFPVGHVDVASASSTIGTRLSALTAP